MARQRKKKIEEPDLKGFKHFKLLNSILERLQDTACDRDRAGNRKLHYNQYTALILLYFFNPIVTSLRGIQQASELKKVQRILGCPRSSLGSLSEAARIFDADLLLGIIGELADELPTFKGNKQLADMRGIITLVDGTVLSALPKLVKAMWSWVPRPFREKRVGDGSVKGNRVASNCTRISSCSRASRPAWTSPTAMATSGPLCNRACCPIGSTSWIAGTPSLSCSLIFSTCVPLSYVACVTIACMR